MLIPLPEIVRSVTTENPWWETGTIPKRFDEMPRRAYFDSFKTLVGQRDVNRAVILLGPRRVDDLNDARILKGRNLMEISVETERTEHWLLRRERDDPCE